MLTYKNLLLIETDVHKTWYQYKGEKLFVQFMTYTPKSPGLGMTCGR